MNEQQKLLRQIRAVQFSMWELHIFLDTHPRDCTAQKKLEEYRKRGDELIAQYESAYGPLNDTSANSSRWAWVKGPWPWETGEEADD